MSVLSTGYDIAKAREVFTKPRNAILDDLLNQFVVLGQLGDKSRVGSFARDCGGMQSGDFAESGIAFEGADKARDGGDIEDVTDEVAAPEGFCIRCPILDA
jgi:hypothetical protein